MSQWCCQICGYIYDPEEGDDEAGIAPGTPFEKLPQQWGCPECGATASNYRKAES